MAETEPETNTEGTKTQEEDDDGQAVVTPETQEAMDDCIVLWQTSAVQEWKKCFSILQSFNHRGTMVAYPATESSPGSVGVFARAKNNMVLAHLNIIKFDFFKCDRIVPLPMRLRDVYESALQGVTNAPAMRWCVKKDDLTTVHIEFASANRRTTPDRIEMKTLSLKNVAVDRHDTDTVWPRVCQMNSADWAVMVKKMFNPWKTQSAEARALATCVIRTEGTSLIFETSTPTGTTSFSRIGPDDDGFKWIQIQPQADGTPTETRSVFYISALNSTHKQSAHNTVEIYLSNTDPLLLRYDLYSGILRLMVAPVTEPEDEEEEDEEETEEQEQEPEDEEEEEEQPDRKRGRQQLQRSKPKRARRR